MPTPRLFSKTVLIAAALSFVAAASASAASITLETSILTTGSCNGTLSSVINNVAAGGTLADGPCTGQTGFNVPTSTEAKARGIFDNAGLSLGAYSSISGRASFSASGESYFTDTATATGGVIGQSGFAQFIMAVDGSAFCTVGVCANPNFDDHVSGLLGIGLGTPRLLSGNYNPPAGSSSQTLPNGTTTVTLQVPVVFGTPFTFTLFLIARSDMSGSAPATETADWFNSAILRQVVLLDGTSNTIINGGSLVSSSNLVYPTAAVPEPASLLLVGAGLAGAARRRRIRNAR